MLGEGADERVGGDLAIQAQDGAAQRWQERGGPR
jgi:hypothetical protein